jgi:enoyl-CoA hydratase/carnithine racemase
MESAVLYSVENGIALITLNRPKRHNAINMELMTGLLDRLDEVANNDDVKVAIITGAGKSFCSGVDLEALSKENTLAGRNDGKELPDGFAACRKPVIGAINGTAITGGFEIALNCDFLIASERATFADTHARVGIHPGWGMTQLLQAGIGQRRAKQMSFSCQFISAEKAQNWGLVNEVVPHEMLMNRAMQIAQDICAANTELLGDIKGLIEFRNDATLSEAFKNERKGFKAFLDKFS